MVGMSGLGGRDGETMVYAVEWLEPAQAKTLRSGFYIRIRSREDGAG